MSFLWFLFGMAMCIGIVICGLLAASVGRFNKWYEEKSYEETLRNREENDIESH